MSELLAVAIARSHEFFLGQLKMYLYFEIEIEASPSCLRVAHFVDRVC